MHTDPTVWGEDRVGGEGGALRTLQELIVNPYLEISWN